MKKFTNDYRSRVTKMLIRRALTELMKTKPVLNISVKELCETAGINRGTFYLHYKDIYDLVEQIENEMLKELVSAIKPLMDTEMLMKSDNQGKGTYLISPAVFRILKEFSDICSVILGPNGDKSFPHKLVNMGRQMCIETYSRLFVGTSRRQIEFYYDFVSAGCISVLQKWMRDGWLETPEEISETVNGIMISGIGFLR